ncbi:MAG: LamG domain-containing protein [Thermoguttaceae bacterium]|nr:LamG domain-containing protein [Thermoguttaceae bacterium]MDW8079185.1 LamG-like jellyroll fold domain-containing protein [Thermoguttaceae bacterium]
MARTFSASKGSYCQLVGELPAVGPPFWVSLWIYPTATDQEECVLFLGSARSTTSFFALLVDATRRVAATTVGPWHGRAEAKVGIPLTVGRWQPVVAQWPATFRREVWTNSASSFNTKTVSVPFVDTLAVGRLSSALPGACFSGAVAHFALGVGSLSHSQIAALLAGVDARLVVSWPKLKASWPFLSTDRDLLGGRQLTAYADPGWAAGPALIGPGSPHLAMGPEPEPSLPTGLVEAGTLWPVSAPAAQAAVSGPVCGQIVTSHHLRGK